MNKTVNPLLERACAGDTAAFDELFEQNVPRLEMVLKQHLALPKDVKDVLQRVRMRAKDSMDRFDTSRGYFYAWLHVIAETAAHQFLHETQRDETEMLDRARAGNQAAFDALYRRHAQGVKRQLARYFTSEHDIEDVVQESFFRAFRSLHTFRGESKFSTWLFRIAENTAKNHLTKNGKMKFVVGEQAERELEQLAAPDTTEEDQEREALLDAIRRVADTLHPEIAQALEMREVRHMSYADIAKDLGCPVGTVRSRLFRAREALKLELLPQ